MLSTHSIIAFTLQFLLTFVTPACVPDVPEKILWDPAVLKHPAVTSALQIVEQKLNELMNTTGDALSLAIAHASGQESVFAFNHGTLRMNETSDSTDNIVTSDSIFRVMSVSKNFAAFSALVVENLCESKTDALATFSLDTPVRAILPQFKLPEKDWHDGGKDITLRMLASHSSGIMREAYSTELNMVLGTSKVDVDMFEANFRSATPDGVLEYVKKNNLMFAPGQRAAYSNTGTSILGTAVITHYNKATAKNSTWSQMVMEQILAPLNMTHSFFGRIPDSLLPDIGIPGAPNFADLTMGLGYDPVGGLWSSSNDLTKYLHNVWLRPDPQLITTPQRRRSLQPSIALPDGRQLSGAGWEIDLFNVLTSKSALALNKTYATYGKAGDGGGWHAWLDVVPNLGYGLVAMTQESGALEFGPPIPPVSIKDAAQEILIPAFAEALATRMEERFAGSYGNGRDGGAIADEVKRNETNSTSYAKLEVEEQILYIRELVVNGTNALEGLDRLRWTAEVQTRVYSTPLGVALTPSEGAGENAEFGPGAQVWRLMIPGLEVCDWFDFDGFKDENGWSLSKFVLVEGENGVELRYPPYDIVLSRIKG